MSDLVAGRYPVGFEEWLLDGSPLPPYRQTISQRDITGAYVLPATRINCYAVPVQAGDIFNYVSFKTGTAGATLTHSWVAVYNGVGTGAQLLAQVTDNTTATGWAATAQKLSLAAAVADVAQPGTPQGASGGPGYWALTAAGPSVWGIVVYQSGTTPNTFDGMAGGSIAGGALAGQIPMYSTGTLAATGTAPAVLPAMTAAAPSGNGGVPYIVLSKQ